MDWQEFVDRGILTELANVFSDEVSAHALLESIGVARGRMPAFGGGSAEGFWRRAARDVDNGLVPGRLDALVAAAAERYPHNPILGQPVPQAPAESPGTQAKPAEERSASRDDEALGIFVSYSHKDDELREELDIHLALLKRLGRIRSWSDRRIVPGDEWAGQIDENLDKADIILLLVSPAFLASDYCFDLEVKRAMERHEAGEARVIPIILRPLPKTWTSTPFSKLQVLPKDAKPVTSWSDRDEAFVNVVDGLDTAVRAELERRAGRMA